MHVIRFGLLWVLLVCATACGAKTGLLIPDADSPMDAGIDAETPPRPDARVDTGICISETVTLQRRTPQVLFVIDRSTSMADTLDGRAPGPGELNRWQFLGQALDRTLENADPSLEFGAEFYPFYRDELPMSLDEACFTDSTVDIAPALGNRGAIQQVFARTEPRGGTPTAVALEAALLFFQERPAPDTPRFVVLATDGGPNCNPDVPASARTCLCTGQPRACYNPAAVPPEPAENIYNCIDDIRTLEVINRLSMVEGIPVYVIGIEDPSREDLAMVLNNMAVAGGRPSEGTRRQFYSVQQESDLNRALTTIADSVSPCVFAVDPIPSEMDTAQVQVRLDGATIPRDATESDGWNFSSEDRSEITLFGRSCDAVADGSEPTAEITCAP